MFPERVETERLVLEPFDADHVDVFELYERFRVGSDGVAEVFAHVPQEPYDTVKDAADQLDRAESRRGAADEARYAVRSEDGDLAGYASLAPEWDRKTAALGVILARPFWGEGYATECLDALAEMTFERLGLEMVTVGYEAGNERSARMVERFVERHGGRYDGCLRNWTPLGDAVADHHRYTVSAAEYRESGE